MLSTKFVRAHFISSSASGTGLAWLFKLIYEFWGYSVNGGNSLTTPGGLAVSGVYQMPWTDSTGLLASGSDGYTAVGMPFFNSSNPTAFSASYVNKWLVTWKSGSDSSDDGVYQITQWLNSSSLRVNVLHGGTPYTGTLHPSFTTRNSVNYRIVDFAVPAAMALTYNTSSLILQFNGAPEVNPGQALSQVRLKAFNAQPGSAFTSPSAYGMAFTVSPSGSWNGTTFVSESIPEYIQGSSNSQYWFTTAHMQTAYVTLIGSQDFLIMHHKGGQSAASGFHIEIPQRLYPAGKDPNPIAIMAHGNASPTTTNTSLSYASGFAMHNPPDNTFINYKGLSRRFFSTDDVNAPGTQTNGRLNGAFYNTFQNKFLFMDVLLSQGFNNGQYQMARVRLRRVRVLPPIIPQFERVGNHGEWLHVQNGVLWPWDNALLPYNLFLGGN